MMEAMLDMQHMLHDTSSEVFVPCDECDNIETLVDLLLVECLHKRGWASSAIMV